MRISDWSSDVCSSDLSRLLMQRQGDQEWAVASPAPVNRATVAPSTCSRKGFSRTWLNPCARARSVRSADGNAVMSTAGPDQPLSLKWQNTSIPSRSAERRGGKELSVRVDIGGRRNIKKN